MKWHHLIPSGHALEIVSLHDGQARCSCGKWEYVFSGKRTKREIERHHKGHLSFLAGKGGKLR